MTPTEIDALLPAGRELDALVAERVMGRVVPAAKCCAIYVEGEWSLHPDSSPEGWMCYAGTEPVMVNENCRCHEGPWIHDGPYDDPENEESWKRINADARREWDEDLQRWGHSRSCLDVVPFYSTSIEAAWEVVEKMLSFKGLPYEDTNRYGTWERFEAAFCVWKLHEMLAEKAAENICRAALKAVSV